MVGFFRKKKVQEASVPAEPPMDNDDYYNDGLVEQPPEIPISKKGLRAASQHTPQQQYQPQVQQVQQSQQPEIIQQPQQPQEEELTEERVKQHLNYLHLQVAKIKNYLRLDNFE